MWLVSDCCNRQHGSRPFCPEAQSHELEPCQGLHILPEMTMGTEEKRHLALLHPSTHPANTAKASALVHVSVSKTAFLLADELPGRAV